MIHVDFPLYAATPNGYTSNLANAVYTEVVPSTLGYPSRNFVDFMSALLSSLNIPVDIVQSHPDWWALDAFEIMNGFMLESYSTDSFSFTLVETYNGTSREIRYTVDGAEAKSYLDGVDVTLIPLPANELPQYGDAYSIESVAQTINSVVEVDCCPVIPNFRASFNFPCSPRDNPL